MAKVETKVADVEVEVEVKDTVKNTIADARKVARKTTLAYVGLYGLAYERAQFRAEQLKKASGELFTTLVKKGEVLETQGLELTKDVRAKATDLVEEGREQVSKVVPFGRKEVRVEELEAEVAALNKKIAALSKKAATPRAKTEKTEKKAA